MKKSYLAIIMALVMSLVTLSFTSCDDDDDNNGGGGGNQDTENALSGNLTSDKILLEGETYYLNGAVNVMDGVTLKIEPGVTIIAKEGDVVGYLMIEQGGKIDAEGTAEKPIIMTAETEEAGAWGGIHICGKAPLNVSIPASSEVGALPYGGTDAHDNSGVLKYVIVKYAGYSYDETHECNGFSFYGVGDGTKVSYCEAYRGSDDGFEFFGGTVGIDHCMSVSNKDDQFDWTEGWSGKCQFLVAVQAKADELGYECDRLIEADNLEDDFDATPVSHPVLSNLTLVGNNSEEETKGITLRRGTQVEIYNALVKGKKTALTVESVQTATALENKTSVLKGVYIAGAYKSDTLYSFSDFEMDGNKMVPSITLSDTYKGTLSGVAVPGISGFDQSATYAGAVSASNDWTAGWSVSDNGAGDEITTLNGNISSDLTLKGSKTYYLYGAVNVLSGATLKIEPGVTIVAKEGDVVGYLMIEQGGKIDAQGTAAEPIVMTAETKEAGGWGGIHICGKAPINVAIPASSEVGSLPYGGTDAHDNSGILKYVRVEYAGYSYDETHECNGFSLYGVGDGTVIDYCEAVDGSDDGFECFGGTVGYSHCVSKNNKDDQFDWTEGWSGKCQFLVAYEASGLAYECDRLIEADNLEDDYDALPVSHPVFSNLTLIGNNSEEETKGVTLRRGTQVEIYNALVLNKAKCLTVESTQTENALLGGTSVLKGVYLGNTVNSKEGIYTESEFTADGNYINQTFNFTGDYIGTLTGSAVPAGHGFDVTAIYAGAVPTGNVWTSGWTK